ncbi:MAG: hypothetical protein NT097_08100 [Actinobacteria bacterium]|nr:hypothetical protein [Actinomycetota bacterium]
MGLVAGIDIGNSTTEIVIASGSEPIAWDRRPTRGIKGSEASIKAAVSLLQSLQREHQIVVEKVVVAPWQPVETLTSTIHEPLPDTGRLQILKTAHQSVVGDGWAIGKPWLMTKEVVNNGPLIAIVPSGVGFEFAAAAINRELANGSNIVGAVIADDEAVLVAKRISAEIPIADGVDVEVARTAQRLFLEVRPQNSSLKIATDVWALRSALELSEMDASPLNEIVRWVKNERTALIALFSETQISIQTKNGFIDWIDGTSTELFEAIAKIENSLIGHVSRVVITDPINTSDIWAFDITKVLADRGLRQVGHTRDLALAQLSPHGFNSDVDLSALFGVPVEIAESESFAARIGATSTPGVGSGAAILDIGGGTIDLISEIELSAAGAGELLTAAVAFALGTSRGAADWIKRGPAQRLESPQVLLSEDGSKAFVAESAPYPASAMGSLVTPGPAGFLTFGQNLQPAEWRIMRQGLKQAAIGLNVSRLIRSLEARTGNSKELDLVVVGGPVADDELLPVIGAVPGIKGIGRGNVAGKLGHRYAVAYGLSQI